MLQCCERVSPVFMNVFFYQLSACVCYRLNDGHLWLMILRRNATKTDLLKVFLSVESGKHVSVRGVDMVKVQAFRLEPLQQGSHVTIDGEVLDYGPVQARILEGAGRVMIKR